MAGARPVWAHRWPAFSPAASGHASGHCGWYGAYTGRRPSYQNGRPVVDYRDPQALRRIGAAAPSGVDVFWDSAGRHDFHQTLPLLARGARVVVMAGLDARPVLPVGLLYTRDASLRGFAISNASVSDLAEAARVINDRLANNGLRTRIGARLPLAKAALAHRLQEARDQNRPRGRIVVLP